MCQAREHLECYVDVFGHALDDATKKLIAASICSMNGNQADAWLALLREAEKIGAGYGQASDDQPDLVVGRAHECQPGTRQCGPK
jgi:hypothetical protein